ncbi:MAG: RNA-binding transcriptional accessory protein [Muribaculaceae bacterium]|nr:RNA-binding transcriptional accessory protein [Muribaculaceae bacterium]
MDFTDNDNIILEVSKRLDITEKQVKAVVGLLDEGSTVPFIARYRKEVTGGLDEVAVRDIELTLKTVRDFMARKEFIVEAIESADQMTPKIMEQITSASTSTELEDIYAPFKPKKRTRATIARERGLEPLAKIIMSGKPTDIYGVASRFRNKDVADEDEALAGACDIIAEWASESARLRNTTRNAYRNRGSLVSAPVKGAEENLQSSPFATYSNFSNSVRRILSHQYLALRRAETEKLIKVKYNLDENSFSLDDKLCESFAPRNASEDCREIIDDAVKDASKRLIRPSVENEISSSLKEEADRVAIDIFATNLRQLLLASPLRGKRILAIDPGYRTGCKVVAIDEQGNLLDDAVIYPVPPRNDFEGAQKILTRLITRHKLNAVALGSGTASRETEKFLKTYRIIPDPAIFIVNEDGASVYSASEIARTEFPDKDVTVRGAVSIGRRLIDPLAELVKIDPKSIGVGQYQHDVDQTKLKNALDYTVMSCVNAVGVDVNTASASLLGYVSGIGPAIAKNIVKYRVENGPFKIRTDLKKVPRLGDKAYQQSAGFLRIADGPEPLDNTGIHPEQYPLVKKMSSALKVPLKELIGNASILTGIDRKAMAKELGILEETLNDIITELKKPGRDPRLDNADTAFHPEIESFEDLRVGMKLHGVVNNITAFGAFVNLGIKDSGLLHISKISKKRITAVSDVLKLGQQIEVVVTDIDTARHRISLASPEVMGNE